MDTLEEKLERLGEIIDPLYEKIDAGETLNDFEDMAMDIYNWLKGDGDEPSID